MRRPCRQTAHATLAPGVSFRIPQGRMHSEPKSTQVIYPARRILGSLDLPGDKSISHRYAILAALAEGKSEIEHFSSSRDCQSTLNCLHALGVPWSREGDRVAIEGVGLGGLRAAILSGRAPPVRLDAENSGTTMRLLAGVLSGQPFDSAIVGDASLSRRPMGRVIEPLAQMGASIRAREGNFAPLEIFGRPLHPIRYALPIASAQVKSAILLAGLFCDGETVVEEPVPTRDHLEIAWQQFGGKIQRRGGTIAVAGRARLLGRKLSCPADLSSAIFFVVAGLLLPDTNLVLHNVGLNPTRTAVLDFLAQMGAAVRIMTLGEENGELAGDLHVSAGPIMRGGVIEGKMVPAMIDELPALAVLGTAAEQGIEIRDAQELRVKESDRIALLASNLRRMGASVEERPDGLKVPGKQRLRGAEIDPQGDHRLAMAFAVAALAADGPTTILGSECADVSFPGFYESLEKVVERG